ncbi:hypothetical protein PENTCL1PPCAC_3126, partial [Pristionchus entomophagus]
MDPCRGYCTTNRHYIFRYILSHFFYTKHYFQETISLLYQPCSGRLPWLSIGRSHTILLGYHYWGCENSADRNFLYDVHGHTKHYCRNISDTLQSEEDTESNGRQSFGQISVSADEPINKANSSCRICPPRLLHFSI